MLNQVARKVYKCLLQIRSSCVLPGSIWLGFISSGLCSVLCSLAAAVSVHIQGVRQCQWQGEGCRTTFSKSFISSFVSWHVSLTLFNCVLWIAVLLVDTSSSEPECQQHDSSRAVRSQQSASPVGSFFSAVTPLRTTPGSSVKARITHIFPRTGQQGMIFLVMLVFLLHNCHCKCMNLSHISMKISNLSGQL